MEERELRLVLDYGIKLFDHQGVPLHPLSPDAAIISHAHLDHSGALPTLYKHQSIASFCTFPTAPLMNLLLEDALKVAERRGKTPPFSVKELKAMNKNLILLPYGRDYEFFDGTTFNFLDAGHVMGSTQIFVKGASGKNVLYSGDFKMEETKMHKGAALCDEPVHALVMESTYATADHPPRRELEKILCSRVRETIESGSTVLLPCFALGRTQELLEVLHAHGIERKFEKVFLDGMGTSVNEIYAEYPSYLKNYRSFADALNKSKRVESRGQRRKIAQTPCIIITTAGMLEGGPALDYLSILNERGKGRVFLTGYQVEGTNGRLLLEQGKIRDRGKVKKINLPVEFYDFSAHAGRSDLLRYVKKLNPEKVFCMHGDEANCKALAETLSGEGFDAFAPKLGERHEV